MIKNWKLFLESSGMGGHGTLSLEDLDIIKDVLIELEDDFGLDAEYDVKADGCIINIHGKLDGSRNSEIIYYANSLCKKIQEFVNSSYEVQLAFGNEESRSGDRLYVMYGPKSSYTNDLQNKIADNKLEDKIIYKWILGGVDFLQESPPNDLNSREFIYCYIWIYSGGRNE
jgi:hypothetical protein